MAIFDFTGANGDALSTGLTASNGTFEINSNKLKATGASPGSPAWIATLTTDLVTPDLTTRCIVNCEGATSGLSGLIARYTDNQNHFFLVTSPSNGRVQLYKRVAGVNSLLSQSTLTGFSASADYALELRIDGDLFTAYVDGLSKFSFTDAFNNTATGFGIRLADTVMSIDNYESVTAIADAGFNQPAHGGELITLNGIGSDTIPTGGTLTSFLWVQSAGIEVNPFTDNTQSTNINAPSRFNAHSISFDLVVGYDGILSVADSMTISVSAGPEASAGPDQEVWVGDTVILDGSAALIPAGLTVTDYGWARQTGSNQGTITDASLVIATFTATSVQTTIPIDVTMRSIVTTAPDGATSSPDLAIITILPNPVANAGSDQSDIVAGATVNLSGSSTGPDTYAGTLLWTHFSGDFVEILNPTTATPSFVAPNTASPQNVVVQLVATYKGKASVADTVTIGVLAALDTLIDFTGSDADPLPPELTALVGNFQINNNQLVATGGNPGTFGYLCRYTNNFTTSESMSLDVDCRGVTTDVTGLLFRYVDTANFIKLVINANTGAMQLLQTSLGVTTILGQFSIPSFSASTIYKIKVDYTPTTIDCWLDGTERISVTNSFNNSSLIAGIGIGVNTHAVDNFNTKVTNVAPIAAITGPTGSVSAGASFQLNWSGSTDSDGTIVSYTLTQVAGTNTGSNLTTVNPSIVITAPDETFAQTLTYELTAKDNELAVSAIVSVDVDILANTEINIPPTAVITGPITDVPSGADFTLDFSGSTDSDGTIINYSLEQTAGTNTGSNGLYVSNSLVVTAPSKTFAQTLTYQLRVIDNDNAVSVEDTVDVNILANIVPTAVSGNQSGIFAGALIQFDFSGSTDPDGTIATYNLTQPGGTPVSIIGANTIPNPQAVAPSTGVDQTLTFNLSVTDNQGATSPVITFTIDVLANTGFGGILTFTGNDGAAIPAELTALAGSGQINNNELVSLGSNPGSGWLFRYAENFTTSEILSVDINCRGDASGVTGLLFRYVDGFNYTKLAINANTGRLQVLETVAGVETVIGQFIITGFSASTIYEVKVDYTPTTIVGYLNGTQVINLTNNVGGTSVIAGLIIGRNTHALDNFNIRGTVLTNAPPTAVITGPLVAVAAGANFTLDFSSSFDTDGIITTYTLFQTEGTNTGSDGTSGATSKVITAPNEDFGQTLRYRLIVTDDDGAPSTAAYFDVVIISNQGNIAPNGAITVSPTGAIPAGGNFTLDFSNSNDPDGTIVSYTLVQTIGTNTGSDGTSNLSDRLIIAPDEPNGQPLRYRLIVTDNDGAPSAAVFINVDVLGNAVNIAPTADAGPNQNNVPAGATVQLNFLGSEDLDGSIATYSVFQTAGDNVGLDGTSTNAEPTFIAPSTPSNQTITLRLIVTDDQGTPSASASFVDINVLAVAGSDTTKPVINLIGPNPYYHTIGTPYVSPKSYVTDNVDVGIVPVITGSIDHMTAGSYSEFHNAVDAANNVAEQVIRTVIVGAQLPVKPISSGTGSSSESASEALLDNPTPEIGLDHIEFELIRITWDLINPEDGVYDFSLIQKLIDRAKSYGKYVNLAIIDSFHAPYWVKYNSSTFDYPFQFTQDDPPVPIIRTAPLAWDSSYLQAKQKLLNQLAAAYDPEDAVRTIYFTYATMTNGAEFHWRVDEALYTAAGYTPEFQLSTAQLIFRYHADAFVRTNIAIESHTVFNTIDLNRGLVEYARTYIGTRAGMALWWAASRMCVNDGGNQSEYTSWLLAEEHKAAGGFLIAQMIGNFTDQAWRYNYEDHPEFGIIDWTGDAEGAFVYERNFFDGNSIYNLTSTDIDAYEYWPKDARNTALMPALLPDETGLIKPVITLTNGNSITIPFNSVYSDPTYVITDDVDAPRTSGAVITGDTVDTRSAGEYLRYFNAVDSDDIAADTVTYTVTVEEADNDSFVVNRLKIYIR